MSDQPRRETGDSATLRAGNHLDELAQLTEFLTTFFVRNNLPSELMADCELALEEVFVNVVRYGFPAGGEHTIDIGATLTDGTLILTVEDSGVAFNPLEVQLSDLDLPLEQRGIGGLGIHLVKASVDEIEYLRANNRNRLVMRKRVGP